MNAELSLFAPIRGAGTAGSAVGRQIQRRLNVVVVGSGYVGLVTGACLAETGSRVTSVDIDAAKIARLERGDIPIFEPGLDDIVVRGIGSGALRFTTSLDEALVGADVVFLALPTPTNADGHADVSAVLRVAQSIGKLVTNELVVVTKSTVPVGTARIIRGVLEDELRPREVSFEVHVASNPEFLKEGSAVDDFLHPDRVVIGVDSAYAEQVLTSLYRPLITSPDALLVMDVASAEITKYAANAMLAMRIAFMNQVASLCESVDGDVEQVRRGIGSDARIGAAFLRAGAGYGGSCFPKDVRAFASTWADAGVDPSMLLAVESANNDHKHRVVRTLRRHLEPAGRTIAVLGVAFKPNTDDIREAPSLTVIEDLLALNARVIVHDPVAILPEILRHRVAQASSVAQALLDADAAVLVTEWSEYRVLDPHQCASVMRGNLLIDGRNVLDVDAFANASLSVVGVGRACASAGALLREFDLPFV